MACGNWSRFDLKAEPGIAYVAVPRAGSGTLRALLQKLHAWPIKNFPHNHACTLRELLETHRARRVRCKRCARRDHHERRDRRETGRPPPLERKCISARRPGGRGP